MPDFYLRSNLFSGETLTAARKSGRIRKPVLRTGYIGMKEARTSESTTLFSTTDINGSNGSKFNPILAEQISSDEIGESLDAMDQPKSGLKENPVSNMSLAPVNVSSNQGNPNHTDSAEHDDKMNLTPSTTPTARNKLNISQRRRENEVLRVIESMGGIANTSIKDFIDAHVALLEAMTKIGEVTSAPVGTRLDRRTLDTALNNLQYRNCIRLVTTSMRAPTGGGVRPAKIAYLSSFDQTAVDEYVKRSNQIAVVPPTSSIKEVDVPHFYERVIQLQRRRVQPDSNKEKRQAVHKIIDVGSEDGNELLRSEMLSEKQTVAQLYGFLVGRAMRARHVHLITLQCFENSKDIPTIISSNKMVIDLNLYFNDISLKNYFSFLSALRADDELERLLSTEDSSSIRLKDLPEFSRRRLQIGRSRSRTRLFELMELLMSLGVVKALEESKSHEADLICDDNNIPVRCFNYTSGSLENTPFLSPPRYWQFCSTAPLYLWAISEDSPPFYKYMPIKSVSDAAKFWDDLKAVCLNKDFSIIPVDTERLAGKERYRIRDAAVTLRRNRSWQTSYIFSENQRQYLESLIDYITGETPIQHSSTGQLQLETICRTVCAPLDAVTTFFTSSRERILRELGRVNPSKRRADNDQTITSFQHKVAEAKAQRELEWDRLMRAASGEQIVGITNTRVQRLRKKFLEGVSSRSAQEWQEEILGVITESRKAINVQKSLSKTRQSVSSDYVAQFIPEDDVERLLRNLVDRQIAIKTLRGKSRTRTQKMGKENGLFSKNSFK